MLCTNCGFSNDALSRVCLRCGRNIFEEEDRDLRTGEKPPGMEEAASDPPFVKDSIAAAFAARPGVISVLFRSLGIGAFVAGVLFITLTLVPPILSPEEPPRLESRASPTANLKGEAVAAESRGFKLEGANKPEAAIKSYELARTKYEELGDQEGMASITNSIARAQHTAGLQDESLDSYTRALGVARTAGSAGEQAVALGGQGFIHQERGEQSRARSLYNQALALAKEAEDDELVRRLEKNLRELGGGPPPEDVPESVPE